VSDLPPDGSAPARSELLVRTLVADLDTVLAALDPQQRQELWSLIADTNDLSPAQVLLALEELLLWADLPANHPVSRALATARFIGIRDAGPSMTAQESLEFLRSFLQTDPDTHILSELQAHPAPQVDPEPKAGLSGPAEGQPIPEYGSYAAVIGRLIDLPALSPEEVRRAGTDPQLPELIRLQDRAAIRLPRFQFDLAGAARPIVLEVNRVLGAAQDPWGVAGWWTDLHAWLERAPMELLDEAGGVDELSELALAEVSA
jgi:hypothetical protein